MNEALRQFALGVAGVRLWYARSPLPGAAPSPEYDFGMDGQSTDEEANVVAGVVDGASPATPMPDPEASRQGLARLQGLLSEDGGKRRSPAALRESPSSPAPERSEGAPIVEADSAHDGVEIRGGEAGAGGDALVGQAVSFHWRFWHGSRWLLVSSSPDEAAGGLEDRLAANILKALGDAPERSETLRWPVFSNPAVPGNDAAGAAEVLAAVAQDCKPSRQLWLGVEPAEPEPGAEALWRALLAPLGEAAVSFPRSLAALSSEPDSKRRLWKALQQAEAD